MRPQHATHPATEIAHVWESIPATTVTCHDAATDVGTVDWL